MKAVGFMVQRRPPEPDYDAVEGAELMLSMLVKELPTTDVFRLSAHKAAGGINPSDTPPAIRPHYATLWWNLDPMLATATLKRLTMRAMKNRLVSYERGPCPECCTPGALIVSFDGGAYHESTHPNPMDRELEGAGLAVSRMPRTCRIGTPDAAYRG